MAKKLFNTTYINNIANSIRNKLGVSTKYKVSEMSGAIDSIVIKTLPQLYAPAIKVIDDTLNIIPNDSNGDFNNNATFIVSVDDNLFEVGTDLTYDLLELTGMTGGERTVKVCQKQTNFANSEYSNESIWSTIENILRLTAKEGDLLVKFVVSGDGLSEAPELYYRLSTSTEWILWFNDTTGSSEEIKLNTGEYISIINKKKTLGNNENSYISMSVNYISGGYGVLTGNIMSLLNSASELPEYAFKNLFINCAKIKKLSNTNLLKDQYLVLPITKLSKYCYQGMFRNVGLNELINELPATELADYCYSYMFAECDDLTTPKPVLLQNAKTLAPYCCEHMFYSCNLIVPVLIPSITTLAEGCYASMYAKSSITTTPFLSTVWKLAELCFYGMFVDCKSLTLSANDSLMGGNIPMGAYSDMFDGCTSITKLPTIPNITSLAEHAMEFMFAGCTSLYVGKDNIEGVVEAFTIPTNAPFTAIQYMFLKAKEYQTTGWNSGTPVSGQTIYYKS